MENSLKYDPLRTFKSGNDRARAIDNLLSVKIETDLENKRNLLLKQLIESEDEELTTQLNKEIKNLFKDIEDLQKSRETRMKKANESSYV